MCMKFTVKIRQTELNDGHNVNSTIFCCPICVQRTGLRRLLEAETNILKKSVSWFVSTASNVMSLSNCNFTRKRRNFLRACFWLLFIGQMLSDFRHFAQQTFLSMKSLVVWKWAHKCVGVSQTLTLTASYLNWSMKNWLEAIFCSHNPRLCLQVVRFLLPYYLLWVLLFLPLMTLDDQEWPRLTFICHQPLLFFWMSPISKLKHQLVKMRRRTILRRSSFRHLKSILSYQAQLTDHFKLPTW